LCFNKNIRLCVNLCPHKPKQKQRRQYGADALQAHMRAALLIVMLALAVGHAARLPLLPPLQARMRAPQTRALLSPATIALACDSGMFTAAQLEYLRATKNSGDARDVAWHRSVTRLVNAHAPERVANNDIMHPLDDDEARSAQLHLVALAAGRDAAGPVQTRANSNVRPCRGRRPPPRS
jgi:hypothetical protein